MNISSGLRNGIQMFSDDFQGIVSQLVSSAFIYSTVSCLLNNLSSELNYREFALKHCPFCDSKPAKPACFDE